MSDTGSTGAAVGSWRDATLAPLIQHIVARRHDFPRAGLPAIDAMVARYAASASGSRVHPTGSFRRLSQQFRREMEGHLQKEEMDLFPLIVRIESGVSLGRFGRRTPRLIHTIGREDMDVSGPADPCRAIRARLAQLALDLETHSRLEDGIVFPRAIGMESHEH
jgi:iron-sulfur cluster repair protein YtfE (RIC family)